MQNKIDYNDPKILSVGDCFRAETGEVVKMIGRDESQNFIFRLYHPTKLIETDKALICPQMSINEWFEKVGNKRIDLKTYEPTGLINKKIKVWQMNDVEWCAGETLDDAIKALADIVCDGDIDDAKELLDDPRELTDDEMNTLKFRDDIENKSSESRTFKEQLQKLVDDGVDFPCYFATSEF